MLVGLIMIGVAVLIISSVIDDIFYVRSLSEFFIDAAVLVAIKVAMGAVMWFAIQVL